MRLILAVAAILVLAGFNREGPFSRYQPVINTPVLTSPNPSCAASLTSSGTSADILTATTTVIDNLTCQ